MELNSIGHIALPVSKAQRTPSENYVRILLKQSKHMSHRIGIVLSNALPTDVASLIVNQLRKDACHMIQRAARRYAKHKQHTRLHRLPKHVRQGFVPNAVGPMHGCYSYNGEASPARKLVPGQLRHDLRKWCQSLPAGDYALLVRVIQTNGHAKGVPARRMQVSRTRQPKWGWLVRDAEAVAFHTNAWPPLRVDLHVWVRTW